MAGAGPAVAFYPARSGPEQTLDVWLLDIVSRGWRRLPDMPLRLGPSKPQLLDARRPPRAPGGTSR